MLSVLAVVVPLAAGDSVNPSTLGPALYLASGRDGVRRVLKFALGAFAVYFLGGVIITVGPGHLLLSLIPPPRPPARHVIELAVGAVLALGGAMVWCRRRSGWRRRARWSRALGRRCWRSSLPALGYFSGFSEEGR